MRVFFVFNSWQKDKYCTIVKEIEIINIYLCLLVLKFRTKEVPIIFLALGLFNLCRLKERVVRFDCGKRGDKR